MEQSEIIIGSKLIAEYLGWKYIPFNDLQGLKKAGWYKFAPKTNKKEKVKVTTITNPSVSGNKNLFENAVYTEEEINLDPIRYNSKNGWVSTDEGFYQYVCRKHDQLRFFNSLDALLPVIKKLEEEDLKDYCYSWESYGEIRHNFMGISFTLYNRGCYSEMCWDLDPPSDISSNFDEENSWVQNTFKTVVETIQYVEQLKTKKDE